MAVKESLPETVTEDSPPEPGTGRAMVGEDSPPEYQPKPKAGPHDLLINILGTSFSITAGENPEYLDEVLAQYRIAVANTQGISGMKDPLKVAILTGFLLCDEINKLKLQFEEEQANAEAQWADDEREIKYIAQNLITRLDKAIDELHSSDARTV